MLEVASKKLWTKHWQTTSRTSGIKNGIYVHIRWGKVSTVWWNSLFPWAWLLNLVGLHMGHQHYTRWGTWGRTSVKDRSSQSCRESTEQPHAATTALIQSKDEAEQMGIETHKTTQEPRTSLCDPATCAEQEQEKLLFGIWGLATFISIWTLQNSRIWAMARVWGEPSIPEHQGLRSRTKMLC